MTYTHIHVPDPIMFSQSDSDPLPCGGASDRPSTINPPRTDNLPTPPTNISSFVPSPSPTATHVYNWWTTTLSTYAWTLGRVYLVLWTILFAWTYAYTKEVGYAFLLFLPLMYIFFFYRRIYVPQGTNMPASDNKAYGNMYITSPTYGRVLSINRGGDNNSTTTNCTSLSPSPLSISFLLSPLDPHIQYSPCPPSHVMNQQYHTLLSTHEVNKRKKMDRVDGGGSMKTDGEECITTYEVMNHPSHPKVEVVQQTFLSRWFPIPFVSTTLFSFVRRDGDRKIERGQEVGFMDLLSLLLERKVTIRLPKEFTSTHVKVGDYVWGSSTILASSDKL